MQGGGERGLGGFGQKVIFNEEAKGYYYDLRGESHIQRAWKEGVTLKTRKIAALCSFFLAPLE